MAYDPHILEVFKTESDNCITRVNNLLLQVEKDGASSEVFKKIKGEVHTLKGDARMLGFESISVAAHKLEDLFALLEKEEEKADSALFKNVFHLLDAIQNAVTKLPEELVSIDISLFFSDEDKKPASGEKVETLKIEKTNKKEETAPVDKKEFYTDEKSELLNINIRKIDDLIGISSIFPRYSNRFSYILDKLNDARKLIDNKNGNANLVNSMDNLVRDFSHELAFYDLSAKEFQDKITKLKLVPLASIFDLFPRLVRDIAHKTEKKVAFFMEGRDVELDKVVVDKLKAILIHMLQNAVDHGCETPEERRKAGKPEEGRIVLKALNKGDNVIIELSDDGYGLDVDRIRMKAVEKGLLKIEQAEKLPDDQIIPILFTPGFSTKEVNVYSGRGIGMDVVSNTVKELNGEITVTTLKNKGTLFSITLPLISSYIPVTVFTLMNNMYAIPSVYINSVLRVEEKSIFDAGKQWKVMSFEDMEISLIDLQVLFGLGNSQDDKNKSVIIAMYRDEITGFIVNELIYEKKMLIRKTSGMSDKFGIIIGAVLSGKEKAIPVLNIINLFEQLKQDKGSVTRISRVKDVSKEFSVKKVLLVENSLVTRNLEKKILSKHNLVILEAGNGKEAIKYLEEQTIDMVITDIEMPVMNGIELISYMKDKANLRKIPILVISSYKTYSSKISKLNVKYFIDKSEFSESLLIETIRKENLLT
ncbi:MAG: response regulator [Spirochaetales bacterium]|nr:response regulator [Spirochaetales bacterium]